MLWLVGQIIDHSNPQEEIRTCFPGDDLFTASERRRGIPIGNQTSQFFANVYLDSLDHFVKDRLGIRGYVRYVDDFLAGIPRLRRLRPACLTLVLYRLASRRSPARSQPVCAGFHPAEDVNVGQNGSRYC